MQPNQIQDLISRYLSGNCTEAEKALVETSYLKYLPNHEPLKEEEIAEDLKLIAANLQFSKPEIKFTLLKKLSIAAAIVVAFGGSLFFAFRKESNYSVAKNNQEKILPGTDKAILTLANGRQIILDKNASTLVVDSIAGISIKKTANGELVYEILNVANSTNSTNQFNTIATPRGSQYTVVLQDGSKVWLNASSSLKYPLVFNGDKRKVELNGEGYFEVAKNKEKPFIVHTANQDVEVLGTHFNINAYPEEKETKTTLLEGKVRVSTANEKALMKPGEQVVNFKSGNTLKSAMLEDASESIAWKNGLFLFNHEDLYGIMSKVSRWYNVEVEYKGNFNNQYYSGTISKFGEVIDVLKIMQLTGSVKFKIEGRRIIVMK
ncbi:FecR family protein [Pedobacter frigiditerrae]|uniref:FecR family protein n=1 Tax=Pedobacter frigiditerrae TaxID=2530452 RepID=A0A4V2MHV8_9SPHI|nr:FecR family protein [Pedobacter frigiditerrae]TCC87926.1 FecR family protein [Pedobacter frigiditerrae]